MPALREKSARLTAFALELLEVIGGRCSSGGERASGDRFTVLTPREPSARGCQLSLKLPGEAEPLNKRLAARGVISDLRRPDVLRVAPVPLYNTFSDVFRFVEALAQCLDDGRGARLDDDGGAR